MERNDLLLEVGLEEMPAGFIPSALSQLQHLAETSLVEARLDHRGVRTYGAPRRLTLYVEGLASQQEDLTLKIRGPAAKVAFDDLGNPSKALLGFARSQGVEIGALVQEEVRGALYTFAVKTEKGRSAEEVLPALLESCLTKLSFPKSMRWGDGGFRFARPLRWLLALYGKQVLPMKFAGVEAGNSTRGHRFLVTGPVAIDEPSQYLSRLEAAWVIADQHRRRELIRKQTEQLAAALGGKVPDDPGLLEEVTHLLEFPTGFIGAIDEKYMGLPEEVLTTSMKEHQRYFPIMDSRGALLPGFIAFRSGTEDHLDTVRAGNERVLRARLADASFFWTEDQKATLSSRRALLDRVVYLEGLGSMGDKVTRLVELVEWLGIHLGKDTWVQARAQRAASLAKSDLVTLMVNEFPELQGIMGSKYALAAGEEREVARAIAEHYHPRFAGDALPVSAEGMLVALADKMDNICGCYLTNLIPSGSQDPYALRRQAQAICNLALEREPGLSLSGFIEIAYRVYASKFPLTKSLDTLKAEVGEFFRQRLHFLISETGVSYDTIEAVLAAGFDKLGEVGKRAQALAAFRREEGFSALLTAYTRAANLAQKGDQVPIREELLADPAEKHLWAGIIEARKGIAAAGGDYAASFKALAALRPTVDNFFDAVLVMAEDRDIRALRLALLGEIVALMDGIADLSKIVE